MPTNLGCGYFVVGDAGVVMVIKQVLTAFQSKVLLIYLQDVLYFLYANTTVYL